MEAGSPMMVRGTAVAHWNMVLRATPTPAGTGASCGSAPRHAGPYAEMEKRKANRLVNKKDYVLNNIINCI